MRYNRSKGDEMKLIVVLGSAREGRAGDAVAAWVMQKLSQKDGIEAELVDLAALGLPFYNDAREPDEIKDRDYHNTAARQWAGMVGNAEAFIFLTAEYNHGYTALLKNAIDWVYHEWHNKPVGYVSYSSGNIAGARVVEQLKPVCLHVGLYPLPNAIDIPKVASFFTLDGEPGIPAFNDMLDAMCRNLAIYSETLHPLREKQS